MLEVIESKSTISIKTNIEFIKKNCNSDDVLYENENILVKSYKVDRVREMLKERKIINGLTLIALQWFFLEYYKN